jgi:hypothetical protein
MKYPSGDERPPHSYLMKLEPGAPLPPGVSPDAQRYRPIETKPNKEEYPVGLPLAMLALVVCGVGSALAGAWPGFVAVPLGLAVAAAWWGEEGLSQRFVRDPAGDYVESPREVVAEQLGRLAAPQRLPTWVRISSGCVGAAFLTLFVLALMDLARGTRSFDPIEVLLPAALGAALVFLAVWGIFPSLETGEIPSSPWFHSLADPSRPLPEDAPLSGGRTPALPDGGAKERFPELADPARPLPESVLREPPRESTGPADHGR